MRDWRVSGLPHRLMWLAPATQLMLSVKDTRRGSEHSVRPRTDVCSDTHVSGKTLIHLRCFIAGSCACWPQIAVSSQVAPSPWQENLERREQQRRGLPRPSEATQESNPPSNLFCDPHDPTINGPVMGVRSVTFSRLCRRLNLHQTRRHVTGHVCIFDPGCGNSVLGGSYAHNC